MFRIGHGYDIHRFEDTPTRDFITLGGIKVAFERGIVAHSDGDVVIHAICDALLGACALGDIGGHFPDTDAKFKDYNSSLFLKDILYKVNECGFKVGNIDVSIIAQVPKLQPYILAMREKLAQVLQIDIHGINIKATTHERLDAIGNKLGIAAHAVVLIQGIAA
ncbi:MAG: 2-C-methyl-D-erythritol 2,4-cyclodiphosphate synthase [Proteobacteria bacterium]|nr:2-C-methyl-D-erythritol 2,4-cyclodiphosphate synthase [Pseudomonadota bacterium]